MPKKSKSKKRKTHRVTRDFLLPDLQSSEDGNPIQSVAKVDTFKSIENVICVCQKTGEILSGSVRGKMRSKKGSTKGSKSHIEAGAYVLIARSGLGTVKYGELNINKAIIIGKYSDSQWNELKNNSDFVEIENSKTIQEDTFDFEEDFDDI
jgi:hypothetical protein